MELNFTVTNQRIKYVSNLYIVEKSRNYLTAKFSFSGSEWKNVAKTAIFKKDDNVINVLLDENGRCTVPWELITRGTLKVSVFGGDLVTVDTAEVKILKSGYEEGNAPSEPTSDVYAQILAELQSIRDDFITEEMLGQAVEDWLAENVVEALSPADVEKIVYDYLDEHKDELKGEKGAVFTPHVSDEGVMSWTNDGGLENPPPVDLKINVGGEYALLTEAGYSLALSIDSNYVMTISLKNKAGEVLDSKNIDFPIESMVVNATYADGVVTFALQNGNVLDVDISDLVRGLVPTSRTIAGVDLVDDITVEELKEALGYLTETDIAELNTSGAVAYYETEYKSVEVSANIDTTIDTITLPAGTYVVQGQFNYADSELRYSHYLITPDGWISASTYDNKGYVSGVLTEIVTLDTEKTISYGINLSKNSTLIKVKLRAVRVTSVEGTPLIAGEIKPWLYNTNGEEIVVGNYNGKPLYRKYIKVPVTSNLYTYTQYSHNIADVEYIVIDYSHSYIKTATTGDTLPLSSCRPKSTTEIHGSTSSWVTVNSSSINYSVGETIATGEMHIFIEYTKTTDEEGSGNSLNPYGIYDAKLDDVKSSIASVSDEVDVVNKKLDTETLISRVSAFSINKSGKYYIVVGTDLPTGVSTNGHLEVSVYADVYKVLRYIPHDSNVEYINVCNSGSWLGWVQLAKKSDIDAIKYPVKLFGVESNTYSAGDYLGSDINMSLYSGFIIKYSSIKGGYYKTSIFTGINKADYQWLDFVDSSGTVFCAGVQVRGAGGLFVEKVGTNKPFIIALYGIPA